MSVSTIDPRNTLLVASTSSAVKTAQPIPQMQEGISKELYSLIGPSAPSLVAHISKPRFKPKQNLGNDVRVKWEQRDFTHGARKDSLKLRHWAKASADPNAENPFCKYDIKATQYAYTDEEYAQFLADEDWTKEETDYLFKTTSDYDGRWYVIHDRYEFPGGAPRTLEALKDRYFSVCRKLVRNRSWTGDDASKNQLLNSLAFDKERELTRKRYLESLENRTQTQKDEEEALYIELKRMEQRERQFRKGRDDLLRTIAGINSGLSDIVADESPFTAAMDVRRKKKGGFYELDSPSTPSISTISLPPPVPAIKRPPAVTSQDVENCIVRVEPPPNNKSGHHAANTRSARITAIRAPTLAQVAHILGEFGISPSRLVMPTRDNVALLEQLLTGAQLLLEQKKQVDKIEQDIQVAKMRLGHRLSDEPGDMDLDEGVEESQARGGNGGRKNRKQGQRSISVSSVDTVSTTRAGTKRQKRA